VFEVSSGLSCPSRLHGPPTARRGTLTSTHTSPSTHTNSSGPSPVKKMSNLIFSWVRTPRVDLWSPPLPSLLPPPGCDITYDVNNFEAIFHTVKLCLAPTGVLLICHDEESCPLSKRARERLEVESAAIGLTMTEIDYRGVVSPNYFHPSVKMWRLQYGGGH
jgi:hypothetical protein